MSVVEGEYHPDNQPHQAQELLSWVYNDTIVWTSGNYGIWSVVTSHVWQYSIQLNQWRRLKEAIVVEDVPGTLYEFNESTNIGSRACGMTGWVLDDEIVVFGGENMYLPDDRSDEKWIFSMEVNQWKKIDDYEDDFTGNGADKIGGRKYFGSENIRNEFGVVISGYGWHLSSSGKYLDDVWLIDFSTFNWTLIKDFGLNSYPLFGDMYNSSNTPGTLQKFSTVFDAKNREILVIGGDSWTVGVKYNHIWNLNISCWQWKFVSGNKSNPFPVYGITNEFDERNMMGGRVYHRSVLVKRMVIVFGGLGYDSYHSEGRLNDIFFYDLDSKMWKFRSRDSAKFRDRSPEYGSATVYNSQNTIGGLQSFGMHLVNNNTEIIFGMGHGYELFGQGSLGDIFKLELAPRCFEKFPNEPGVCNSRGECVDYNCQCDDGFHDNDCSVSVCFGLFSNSSLDTICNGLGICVEGNCLCYASSAYTLDDCSVDATQKLLDEILWMLIVFPIVGLISCIVILVFIVVILFVICSLCKRVKKYSGLDAIQDIDVLLEEHRIGNLDSSKAKVKKLSDSMNKKLFEIKHSELSYLRILGQGGSETTVFLVSYRDQYYAYKKFRASMLDDVTSLEEFEKELALISSLRHPNIIGFYGACVVPPTQVGILLEYCKFGDASHYVLSCKIEGKELKIDERVRLCREIAMGMSYLHRSGVVHRDLKPENVLISDTKSAKVMDFGLSKFSESFDKTQTRKVGTSYFIAPECHSGYYSNKIDVYSYAIVVYVIITGKPSPYGTSEARNAMFKAAKDPSFRPKIDPKLFSEVPYLKSFLKRNWAHDPTSRDDFQSIVKFFEAKSKIIGDSTKELKNAQPDKNTDLVLKLNGKIAKAEKKNQAQKRRIEVLEKKNRVYLKKIKKLEKTRK